MNILQNFSTVMSISKTINEEGKPLFQMTTKLDTPLLHDIHAALTSKTTPDFRYIIKRIFTKKTNTKFIL